MKKLKIIPGRGLTGRDIKARLKNRTLQGQLFGDDQYMIDEEMGKFTKMNKVEQIEAVRANNKKIAEAEGKLQETTYRKHKAEEEARIEREVKIRMEKLGKQQVQNQTT